MRKVVFTPKWSCDGPVLLSHEDLEQLDKSIATIKNIFIDSLEKDIKEKEHLFAKEAEDLIEAEKIKDAFYVADEPLKKSLSEKYRQIKENHRKYEKKSLREKSANVSLKLIKSDKYYPSYGSLEEASRALDLDSAPESLEYEVLMGGYYDPKISIECNTKQLGGIRVAGSPDGHPAVEDAYAHLLQWSQRVKPPLYLHLWSFFGSGAAFILFWIALTMAAAITTETKSTPTSLALSIENIVKTGVTDTNRNEATHLLLRVANGEKTSDLSIVPKKYSRFSLLVLFAIPIIVFIRPTTGTIGIKDGVNKVKFWKYWIWLITWGAPTFITITLLTNFIEKMAG